MGRLWEALIQLANVQENSRNTTISSVLIPHDADIKRLNGLEIVPVPTITIPVSPSGEYPDIIGIYIYAVHVCQICECNNKSTYYHLQEFNHLKQRMDSLEALTLPNESLVLEPMDLNTTCF
jgi:hypothetical protein